MTPMLTTPAFIKKAWAKLRSWWPWPKEKKKPEVLYPPPLELDLIPIEPPVLRIEIVYTPEPEPEAETGGVGVLSVDSELQRRSVLATRYGRLPFGRRFTLVVPDGTITSADWQVIGGSYAGISAGEADDTEILIRCLPPTVRVNPRRLVRQMTGRAPRF